MEPIIVFLVIWIVWELLKKQFRKRKLYNSPYSSEVVDYLENVAKELPPSNKFLKEAKDAAWKICKKLNRGVHQYGLSIGRTRIAGSLGKGTGISYMKDGKRKNPDLDIIAFVNDQRPPFKEVFQIFEKLLWEMDEVMDVKRGKFSIQIRIYTPTHGIMKVDLLAATNFVKNTAALNGRNIGDVEANYAFIDVNGKQIRSIKHNNCIDQEYNKLLSSAFAEKTVDIINYHVSEEFVLKVVRLAKFWNSQIEISSPLFPARSCMIELIAIYSQRKKPGRESKNWVCLVSGFRRFLECMRDLKSLNISLDDMSNNSNEFGFSENGMPMVTDPVNTWNNLAHRLNPVVRNTLASQAEMTLELLGKLKKGDDYDASFESDLDEIFRHKRKSNWDSAVLCLLFFAFMYIYFSNSTNDDHIGVTETGLQSELFNNLNVTTIYSQP